jgi:hypothetical protein
MKPHIGYSRKLPFYHLCLLRVSALSEISPFKQLAISRASRANRVRVGARLQSLLARPECSQLSSRSMVVKRVRYAKVNHSLSQSRWPLTNITNNISLPCRRSSAKIGPPNLPLSPASLLKMTSDNLELQRQIRNTSWNPLPSA